MSHIQALTGGRLSACFISRKVPVDEEVLRQARWDFAKIIAFIFKKSQQSMAGTDPQTAFERY
jgi:hypothetical protein